MGGIDLEMTRPVPNLQRYSGGYRGGVLSGRFREIGVVVQGGIRITSPLLPLNPVQKKTHKKKSLRKISGRLFFFFCYCCL